MLYLRRRVARLAALHEEFKIPYWVYFCWNEKTPSGVRTAAGDIAKVGERLKLAEQHYKDLYEHKD